MALWTLHFMTAPGAWTYGFYQRAVRCRSLAIPLYDGSGCLNIWFLSMNGSLSFFGHSTLWWLRVPEHMVFINERRPIIKWEFHFMMAAGAWTYGFYQWTEADHKVRMWLIKRIESLIILSIIKPLHFMIGLCSLIKTICSGTRSHHKVELSLYDRPPFVDKNHMFRHPEPS